MVVLTILLIVLTATTISADYWTDRAKLISSDQCQNVGSSIILSKKEEKVNEILMNYKLKEYDEGFRDPRTFLPSIHFFHSKKRIEESPVFDFLKKLPKGASLHSHDGALVSSEYVYNLTFLPNLYGCVKNGRLQLHFFSSNNVSKSCKWELVSDLRKKNSSFDNFLKSQISIVVDDPTSEYPTITEVWKRFSQTYSTVFGLICYAPVFQNYFYQALKELYEDNVLYVEFRGILPPVYELDGTTYNPEDVVILYIKTLEKFQKDYPDFYGARLIYAPSRNASNITAENYVNIATKLKTLYPDFIAGFDLVGKEDGGKPLVNFIPQLQELAKIGTKFFFHAGETDWFGTTTDMNLFDAVLLNATRIGHGYAILKHPQILQEVKKRDIAIEISPISNQVLKLVDDLRNHPGTFLLASNYSVVISCDDPSFWGAKGLSYDWYIAFMGLASRESDLKLLKQLAINSLVHSVMEEEEKREVIAKWELLWDQFLDSVIMNNVDVHSVVMIR